MFKNTKKEDQQIPKKFQEILSVEEVKDFRDRKFRDIPDYGETKEQIFKAINKYVNSEFSFPIYLYDKKGDHVFSLHSQAQAEAEEKGYVFERDDRGCISINIKK